MPPHLLLFDLDGTLYPNSNPYRAHVHRQLFKFMREHLPIPDGVPPESIWRPLFNRYHQSERAFRAQGWEFDHVNYWRYIRGGVENFIVEDPELDRLLSAFPSSSRKIVFTNAREEQAEQTLQCLGIARHLPQIFGADFMGLQCCKPEKEAFVMVNKALENEEGLDVVLFEDSIKNLLMAKQMGWRTILLESVAVDEEGQPKEVYSEFDAVIPRLTLQEVQKAAGWLFEDSSYGSFGSHLSNPEAVT